MNTIPISVITLPLLLMGKITTIEANLLTIHLRGTVAISDWKLLLSNIESYLGRKLYEPISNNTKG